MAEEEKKKRKRAEEPFTPPENILRSALCGSFACAGCYDVGDVTFHPPRAGYDQARLIALDGE